ncbi:putative glycerol kinase 5 isoform X1 [Danaus plexippus]|uniref:putative glycerol kinase 5 isoform X1 n=1 Tax=Danaus plexippus TaxID=13037 RepID=UPI002AB10560|nr:putative glycerol kinase 5 isoform X1 [Danaus plexippus]
MGEKYILSLDIGTSTIRSVIYNTQTEILGKAVDQVTLHYPSPGFVEIDPDELWKSVVGVVNKSLQNANLSANQITAMGISTQRSTFITWSQDTGKPFHRFITWKDLRADELVKQWNDSYTWKFIKISAYVLFMISRSKRFRAGSVFKFSNNQTTLRLYWALHNVPALKSAIENNDAMFGTLDTWLLYKMTGNRIHMTDVSSASATGFFDPYTMQWAGWAMAIFGIPMEALPEVVDTAGEHFTSTAPDIWGHAIPIRSCIADQTASMWGSCCFSPGDVKLTMGTGTFLNIHTGASPHTSLTGLYPVVGWRMGDELVFSAEGANNDTASIIKWAQNLGLFDNPQETADIAMSVPDSDGVFFIPAFSGLGPPYNDCTAASGFVGMKASTTRAHLVRAVLESLAFRTSQLYTCIRTETSYQFDTVRLDGGVSNNDFLSQLVADLTGLTVERPVQVEMSSLGCAHIVGLQLGIFTSKEQLKSLRKVGKLFTPRAHVKKSYEPIIEKWEDAVKRMCGWYNNDRTTQSNTQNNLKVKLKKQGKSK